MVPLANIGVVKRKLLPMRLFGYFLVALGLLFIVILFLRIGGTFVQDQMPTGELEFFAGVELPKQLDERLHAATDAIESAQHSASFFASVEDWLDYAALAATSAATIIGGFFAGKRESHNASRIAVLLSVLAAIASACEVAKGTFGTRADIHQQRAEQLEAAATDAIDAYELRPESLPQILIRLDRELGAQR